jgi:hypothetical protein
MSLKDGLKTPEAVYGDLLYDMKAGNGQLLRTFCSLPFQSDTCLSNLPLRRMLPTSALSTSIIGQT